LSDPTEAIRREMVAEINAKEGSREWLEDQYGEVWTTGDVQRKFTVLGFGAPFVTVIRKSDKVRGSLMFQHNPRFYFNFEEE